MINSDYDNILEELKHKVNKFTVDTTTHPTFKHDNSGSRDNTKWVAAIIAPILLSVILILWKPSFLGKENGENDEYRINTAKTAKTVFACSVLAWLFIFFYKK